MWLLGLPVAALLCSLALAAPASARSTKLYATNVNAWTCPGGLVGKNNPLGQVRYKSTAATFSLRHTDFTPGTHLEAVLFVNDFLGCSAYDLDQFTIDDAGSGSVSLTYPQIDGGTTGHYEVRPPGSATVIYLATHLVTF